MPSAAIRPSRFFALARPCLRKLSVACSMLPSASTSAFLHSIIPAPVFSRRALTISAVISIDQLILLNYRILQNRRSRTDRVVAAPMRLPRIMLNGITMLILPCFRQEFPEPEQEPPLPRWEQAVEEHRRQNRQIDRSLEQLKEQIRRQPVALVKVSFRCASASRPERGHGCDPRDPLAHRVLVVGAVAMDREPSSRQSLRPLSPARRRAQPLQPLFAVPVAGLRGWRRQHAKQTAGRLATHHRCRG